MNVAFFTIIAPILFSAQIFAEDFFSATMEPSKKQELIGNITSVALIFTGLLIVTVIIGLILIRKNNRK